LDAPSGMRLLTLTEITLMNDDTTQPTLESADSTPTFGCGTTPAPESLPFSFGAAGITTLWCFFHGRVGLGILFLVSGVFLVPISRASVAGALVVEAIGWTIAVVMGLNGSRIAWEERRYQTVEELSSGERGWTVAGVIFLGLRVVLTIAGLAALG